MTGRLILKNVRMLDGDAADIILENGVINEIALPGTATGEEMIDYENKAFVSSGWIDMHVHAFPEFEPYGDDVDEIGYKTGVTTVIDAGSTGADQISDLVKSCKSAKTNVFAFLNISRIGLKRIDELSNLSWINEDEIRKAFSQYGDFIVGLKARISKSVVGPNGVEPLRIARRFSSDTGLPLMVHIGSGPPDIKDVLELLEEKDIITHYLNGKANNLFEAGEPLPELTKAIERGVHLDVGHGTASFSFPTAEMASEKGIRFNTISTDIYRRNRENGPVFNMANVLTKFLYLGYPLKVVIDAVTVNAAAWLRKPELGRISVGDIANLTLFSVEDESSLLRDSEGEERMADKRIVAKGVVINGEFFEC
ncbi:amidohydrolase/deacetylase family metallohydrolase [Peribacillus sp. SI8-4]|uniref:amidohydrolase/deacetylase family metallohydrolase n=1 Tax=Peribacillus sp. SI8-4 TaxID=3048009 RepID=UPI002555B13D|nr:amidohydrolase/deacetylase family metallohydrolase [Peribacillus sp. SI8-4]